MWRNIGVVARYTFVEGLRARFVVAALLVGFGMLLLASVVAAVPYGRVDQLILRIGWGIIQLTGIALAVFFTVQHLHRERDQRVMQLLLAKPLLRGSYGLGKFCGIGALLAVAVIVQGLALTLFVWLVGEGDPAWGRLLVEPAAGVLLKCLVLLAVALAMTTLASPLLAMLTTFAYYLAGAGAEDFARLARRSENPTLEWLAGLLRWLAPDFPRFDTVAWATYGFAVTAQTWAQMGLYFGSYALIWLLLYLILFERLELG